MITFCAAMAPRDVRTVTPARVASIRLALEVHRIAWDPDRLERILARKVAAFEASIPAVPFFPGAPELVRSLAREVPVGIASGARHAEIEAVIAAVVRRTAPLIEQRVPIRGVDHQRAARRECLADRPAPRLGLAETAAFEAGRLTR